MGQIVLGSHGAEDTGHRADPGPDGWFRQVSTDRSG